MTTTTTYRTAGLQASAAAPRSWSRSASSIRTSALAGAGVAQATVTANPMFVGQDLTFDGKPNHRRRWLSEPSP